MGDGRREITDERGGCPTLGDGAFRRIVRGVEIKVWQIADQALGPAGARHAALLAGHEFERTVGAKMQHGVRTKILAHPAIEGRKRMGRRKALFKQQAHRIALVTKGRLHADEHVSELRPKHKDRRAVALLAPWGRSPLRFNLVEITLVAHVIFSRYARMNIGLRAIFG